MSRERLVQRAYDSWLGDAVVRLGLRSTLKQLYGAYLYRQLKGRTTVSVTDVEAAFDVQSPAEAFEIGQNVPNESPIIEDVLNTIDETDSFWDVGGFLGSYACFVGQRAGETVVFEPDENNVRRLEKNLELNDIDATVINEPLGEDTGADEANDTVAKSVISGDDAREKYDLPAPDVMKIDVDGPELHVLRGLERTLIESSCRLIWIEVHPNRLANRGQSRMDLIEWLESLDFETDYRTFEGLGSPYLRAFRDEVQNA